MKLHKLVLCLFAVLKAGCCSWYCPSSNAPAPNEIPEAESMHEAESNIIPQSEIGRIVRDGGFCLVFNSEEDFFVLKEQMIEKYKVAFGRYFKIEDMQSKSDKEKLQLVKSIQNTLPQINADYYQALKLLPQKHELMDCENTEMIIFDPTPIKVDPTKEKVQFLYAKRDHGQFYLLKPIFDADGKMTGSQSCAGFTDQDKENSCKLYENLDKAILPKIGHQLFPAARHEDDAKLDEIIIDQPARCYSPLLTQINKIDGESIGKFGDGTYRSVAFRAQIKGTKALVLLRSPGISSDLKPVLEYVIPSADKKEFVRTDKQGAIDFYSQDAHNLLKYDAQTMKELLTTAMQQQLSQMTS